MRRFFFIIFLLSFGTVLAVTWVTGEPRVQRWLGEQVTRLANDATGIDLRVEWIYWNPLGGALTFGDTVLLDPGQDVWLSIPLAEVQLGFGRMGLRTLDVTKVELHGVRARINVDPDYNVQPFDFLVDAMNAGQDLPVSDPTQVDIFDFLPGFKINLRELVVNKSDLVFTTEDPWEEVRFRDSNVQLEFVKNLPANISYSLHSGSYEILDWRYEGVTLDGSGLFTENDFIFIDNTFHVDLPQIDVELDGKVHLNGQEPVVQLDIDGLLDVSLVNLHYTDIPELLGTLDTVVDIDIHSEKGIFLNADLWTDAMGVQGGILTDVSIRYEMDEDAGYIRKFEGRDGDGALSVTGVVRWFPDIFVAMYTNAGALDLKWGGRFLESVPMDPEGKFTGSVNFEFPIEPEFGMDMRIRGKIDRLRASILDGTRTETVEMDLDGNVTYDGTSISIRDAVLLGELGRIEVTSDISMAAGNDFFASGIADIEKLQWLGIDSDFGLAGRAHASFELTTTEIVVEAASRYLRSDLGEIRNFGGGLRTGPRRGVFRVDQANVGDGNTAGIMNVVYDDRSYSGSFTAFALPISVVAGSPTVDGRISGHLSVAGRLDEQVPPVPDGRIWIEGLRVAGLNAGNMEIVANRTSAGQSEGRIELLDGGSGVIRFVVDAQRKTSWATGELRVPLPADWQEFLEFRTASLQLGAKSFERKFHVHTFISSEDPLSAGSGELVSSISADQDGISLFLAKGGERAFGRVTGVVDYEGLWAGGGFATWDDVVLDDEGMLPNSGSVAAILAARQGNLSDLSGLVRLAGLSGTVGQVALNQDGIVNLEARRGNVHLLEPFVVNLGDYGQLQLDGTVELARSYDLSLRGTVPARILQQFDIGVDDADGILELGAEVKGPWNDPTYSGAGTIAQARAKLAGVVSPVERISGSVTFLDGQLNLNRIQGQLGQGTIVLAGTVGISPTNLWELDLDATMDSSRVQITEKLNSGLRGRLRLTGNPESAMLLSGDIEAFGLRYRDEIEWERALLQLRSTTAGIGTYEKTGSPTVDVRVRGVRDLQVVSNLLNGSFSTDLELRGSTSDLRYFGVVEFEQGSLFYFRGQTYELRRGIVQYVDPEGRTPFLDIEATTNVLYVPTQDEGGTPTNYRITLTIFGQADQLQIRFQSDPQLPETDILSLLSLGVRADDFDRLLSTQSGGLEISSLILSGQISRLENEIQSLIGFDRIEIAPAFDSSDGSRSMQVSLQKQLARNLSLRLSTGLDIDADQRIELGYRVSRGLDISIGWDNSEAGLTGIGRDVGNFFTRPRLVVPIP